MVHLTLDKLNTLPDIQGWLRGGRLLIRVTALSRHLHGSDGWVNKADRGVAS